MAETMFMIVPPISPWDRCHEEQIMLHMGASTLSKTAGEAWSRHTRQDMSKVQHWHDRGYRLRRVRVELLDEAEVDEVVNALGDMS